MYIVPGNMSLDDLHILIFTNLPDQIPDSLGNLTPQNRLAVFCEPHDVIFQIINGIASLNSNKKNYCQVKFMDFGDSNISDDFISKTIFMFVDSFI